MLTSPKSESIARERKTPLVFTQFKGLGHSYVLRLGQSARTDVIFKHDWFCPVLKASKGLGCIGGLYLNGLFLYFLPQKELNWQMKVEPRYPRPPGLFGNEGHCYIPCLHLLL